MSAHKSARPALALVAQGIEQRFPKPCVAGSNPAEGTTQEHHSGGTTPRGTTQLGMKGPRPDATPFPWRHHLAELQRSVHFPSDPTQDAASAARDWITSAHQSIASASVGAYINRLEPGRPLTDYYGTNLDRLRRIKTAVDPTGFFRSPYTV